MDATEIQRRARALLRRLSGLGAGCDLIPGRSMIGGGSLPEESLPTSLIALPASGADEMARVLRMGKPSVVGRIVEGRVVLDLRTVLPAQEDLLIGRLAETLGKGQAVAR